jgi:hypothetical protein
MSYEPVLGIDLGASYSKVALRSESARSDAHTFYTKFIGQVSSLCVRDIRRGKEVWFFGSEAAGMKLGAGATKNENWKADLYSQTSSGTYAGAVIVAHKFFEWLNKWLISNGINPTAQRVRVCVPALENVEPYASTVAQIMEASGWPEVEIVKVSEPRANAVGIMSGGRNCLLKNGVPGYGPMYGQGSSYAHWVRQELHGQRAPLVRVCIIDVGSFTTDLAGIIVNLHTAEADGIRTEIQKSWLFGIINELDKLSLPRVLSGHGLNTDALTFTEQEELKEQIYAGKEFAVVGATVGGAKDQKIIAAEMARFCQGIAERIRDDILEFKPEIAYLTGGGSQIPAVYEALVGFLAKLQCTVIPVPFADGRSTEERAERGHQA